MEILGGLDDSLRAMGFAQQLLAFLFVAGYSLALGGLPEPRGRRRAWWFSAVMAAGFVAMTRPWVHGALLVAFSVAAVGLFIAVVWILSGVLSLRQRRASDALPAAAAETPPGFEAGAEGTVQPASDAGSAPTSAVQPPAGPASAAHSPATLAQGAQTQAVH